MILLLEFVMILRKAMVFLVTTEIGVHKMILVRLEFVLDLIRLFVLRLINAIVLEFVIPLMEFAATLQRMITLAAMMEINALNPILVNLEYVLDPIILFVVF